MKRENREFLAVLALLAILAFGSGYLLGLRDGSDYAVETIYGAKR